MTDEQRLQNITNLLLKVRDNLFKGMGKKVQKLQAEAINEELGLGKWEGSSYPDEKITGCKCLGCPAYPPPTNFCDDCIEREWPYGATVKLRIAGQNYRNDGVGWAKRDEHGKLVSCYSNLPLNEDYWEVVEERT